MLRKVRGSAGVADESQAEYDKLTLRCSFKAKIHKTVNLEYSVKSPTYHWRRVFVFYNLCISVSLLSSLWSHCHLSQICFLCIVSLCHSLCCGHAVRLYSTSFTETAFPPSSVFFLFLLSHCHSSLRPLCMQTRQFWWFLSWGILWFLI